MLKNVDETGGFQEIETPKMKILTIGYHPARNASCLSYVTLLEQTS